MKSQKEVLERQISILKSVFLWHEGKVLSEAQAEELLQWGGWGLTKAMLYNPYKIEEWENASIVDKSVIGEVMRLHELLKENLSDKSYTQVISSIKESVLSSYYTPAVIPDTFFKIINGYIDVKSIMDPSAGGGIFALSAMNHLPNLEKVTVYEKDLLTSKVLSCIMDSIPNEGVTVYNKPFEESDAKEDGKYDIVATNPPYGNYPVYDPTCTDKNIANKVHNYFVWKGLNKLKDGGIMVYLITNTFLDSPSNKSARKYLYSNADHISIICMSDNLFKESANTEAPSHFIVVRRRYGKTEADMNEEEKLLCESETMREGKQKGISINNYIGANHDNCTIGESRLGKNQYGKPAIETWWDGDINDIGPVMESILRRDLNSRWIEKDGMTQDMWAELANVPDLTKKEPTLSESFQQIADIMKPYLETSESPLDEVDTSVMSDPEYYPEGHPWSDRDKVKEIPEHLNQYPVTVEKACTPPELLSVKSYSPDLIVQAATPIKPGTLIATKEGSENLFEDRVTLVTVQEVKENGEVVGVPLGVKKTDSEKLRMYVEIRDTFMKLNKMEQDGKENNK